MQREANQLKPMEATKIQRLSPRPSKMVVQFLVVMLVKNRERRIMSRPPSLRKIISMSGLEEAKPPIATVLPKG